MSLLDSAGIVTGDIWMNGAFTFDSPLKDLLDSEEYTLEQLLAEDELLQEMRGIHPQLIDKLSTEEAVAGMIRYIVLPPNAPPPQHLVLSKKPQEEIEGEAPKDGDNGEEKEEAKTTEIPENDTPEEKKEEQDKDAVYVRYPYMACEVICCELKGIIDTIVDGFVPGSKSDLGEQEARPMRILDLLFSMLYDAKVGEIDDYRAGYFDKILSVLFRKRPQALSQYINEGGGKGDTVLMKAMFDHLYSHSLMQIVQRLLLPQPPLPQKDEDDDDENKIDELYIDPMEGADDGLDLFRCSWSESESALEMLLDCLITTGKIESDEGEEVTERRLDLYLNASEVLITIIQNSPLTFPSLKIITSDPVLEKLMIAASCLEEGTSFSPHDSKLTCAMNVLESLILQLGGYGSVGMMFPEDEEGDHEYLDPMNDSGKPEMATSDTLISHLPMMLSNLCKLLQYPEAENWVSPMQFSRREPQQLLGSSRLKIVRLTESLVLLGDPNVDSLLCDSNCLEICLDLFWKFQWCSMLHQSVANLLVHVFEGQNARSELQSYFLVKCNLIGRLMDSFWEKTEDGSTGAGRLSEMVMAMKSESVPTSSVTGERGSVSSKDDVIPVSDDDVDAALEQEEANQMETSAPETMDHAPAQSFRLGYMGHVIIICQALVHACTSSDGTKSGDGSVYETNSEGVLENFVQGQNSNFDPPKAAERSLNTESAGTEATSKASLILAQLVETHPLSNRWQEFITTTLASETAIQSTPLGGFQGSPLGTDPLGGDPLHAHRPGLADDGDMDDDGAAPALPPRGLLVGGDTIDMDDNDLDVAASMMAGLSMNKSDMLAGIPNDNKNAGGYMFDDPLGDGRFGKFDNDSDSSSDEESELSNETGGSGGAVTDGAPPVMDLFAGNFDINGRESPVGQQTAGWSDFANFDDAFADMENNGSETGLKSSSNGEDANIFGDEKDHVQLLNQEEMPEYMKAREDDESSSDEEPRRQKEDDNSSSDEESPPEKSSTEKVQDASEPVGPLSDT